MRLEMILYGPRIRFSRPFDAVSAFCELAESGEAWGDWEIRVRAPDGALSDLFIVSH
jgi:hypothetical protein